MNNLNVVQKLCKKHGISNEKLADEMGYSVNTIKRILKNPGVCNHSQAMTLVRMFPGEILFSDLFGAPPSQNCDYSVIENLYYKKEE